MIDTHAHLEACADPPHELVARARVVGVSRILAVGSTIESCGAALAAAEEDDGVYAILGIHPHEAASEGDRLDELRPLLAHPRAVAVGETGLDFYRDRSPRERQQAVFEAELDLAAELRKPVVVHTRAADGPTAETLRRFDGTVVLHCFSSAALLPVALERGYYVSFAGNVTFPNASDLRVAELDADVRYLRQVRLERAVDLDGVDERDPLGEVAREDAEPGADLEHDVLGLELGETADDAEDVLVDEEVLAEVLLRADGHERPKAAVAFASICASSSVGSSSRAAASAASVWTTFAGSFGRPRTGCGARYGLSVSASRRSAGTCVAATRRSDAFGKVTFPAKET